MKIQIKKLEEGVKLPHYEHEGDAGMDIYAYEDAILKPLERKLIRTGFQIAVPKGYEAQIRPKSGLALEHGITMANSPGTIDHQYRGEVKIIAINLGNKDFKVEKGKKIAQMVVNKIENAELDEVSSLDETKRGEGGFGSTGR